MKGYVIRCVKTNVTGAILHNALTALGIKGRTQLICCSFCTKDSFNSRMENINFQFNLRSEKQEEELINNFQKLLTKTALCTEKKRGRFRYKNVPLYAYIATSQRTGNEEVIAFSNLKKTVYVDALDLLKERTYEEILTRYDEDFFESELRDRIQRAYEDYLFFQNEKKRISSKLGISEKLDEEQFFKEVISKVEIE